MLLRDPFNAPLLALTPARVFLFHAGFAHVGASRKAVKAAIVLLPLLGITNVLNMIVAPLGRSAAEFGLWSYATHFLTSFQGFFIALLYCFLNGEVSE